MKGQKLEETLSHADELRRDFQRRADNRRHDPASAMSTSYGLGAMAEIMGFAIVLIENQQKMQEEIDALKERIQELEAPKTVRLAKPAFKPSRE